MKMEKSVDRFTEIVKERFWSKVQKTSGCWLWTGWKNNHGYGVFYLPRDGGKLRAIYAHIASFLLRGGTIPEGKELGHFPNCPNKHCVLHVRPITHQQN